MGVLTCHAGSDITDEGAEDGGAGCDYSDVDLEAVETVLMVGRGCSLGNEERTHTLVRAPGTPTPELLVSTPL